MLLKKKKSVTQLVALNNISSRLHGVREELLSAGEPMLSMKLGSVVRDIQMAIENSVENNT